MVDDGNDYYLSHSHDPVVEYKFKSAPCFPTTYLKELMKYTMGCQFEVTIEDEDDAKRKNKSSENDSDDY